jgi:hypothetical protein
MLPAYFGAYSYFEERPIFGKEDLILEHVQQVARKTTCIKRRKSNMQEENPCGKEAGKPNHDRVRVFVKDCNGYKPIK